MLEDLKSKFCCSRLKNIVFFMLQLRNEVSTSFERMKRELYKSESSKDDW